MPGGSESFSGLITQSAFQGEETRMRAALHLESIQAVPAAGCMAVSGGHHASKAAQACQTGRKRHHEHPSDHIDNHPEPRGC